MPKPTDRTRTVRLSLATWNTLFCALSDAIQHNHSRDYPACAGEIVALKRSIEEQVGAAVTAAFAEEFPDYAKTTKARDEITEASRLGMGG